MFIKIKVDVLIQESGQRIDYPVYIGLFQTACELRKAPGVIPVAFLNAL